MEKELLDNHLSEMGKRVDAASKTYRDKYDQTDKRVSALYDEIDKLEREKKESNSLLNAYEGYKKKRKKNADYDNQLKKREQETGTTLDGEITKLKEKISQIDKNIESSKAEQERLYKLSKDSAENKELENAKEAYRQRQKYLEDEAGRLFNLFIVNGKNEVDEALKWSNGDVGALRDFKERYEDTLDELHHYSGYDKAYFFSSIDKAIYMLGVLPAEKRNGYVESLKQPNRVKYNFELLGEELEINGIEFEYEGKTYKIIGLGFDRGVPQVYTETGTDKYIFPLSYVEKFLGKKFGTIIQ